jgi:hypothetical protein
MVSFTIQPPCSYKNKPSTRYMVGWVGPKSPSGHFGEEKNLLSLLEIETRFLGRPGRTLVTIPTELYKLGVEKRIILKWILKSVCQIKVHVKT